MKIKRLFLSLMTIFYLNVTLCSAGDPDWTLADLIKASPILANQLPSLRVGDATRTDCIFNNKTWQIRLFTYEVNISKQPELVKKSFEEMICLKNFISAKPKPSPEGHVHTYFFRSPQEEMKNGLYYLISLRNITDSEEKNG